MLIGIKCTTKQKKLKQISHFKKKTLYTPNPLFLLILEPIIRFSEIKYSVREPQVKGDIAILKIPVLRLGDTSKMSVVRVHTKDGSATSGEDYNPLSEGETTWLELPACRRLL